MKNTKDFEIKKHSWNKEWVYQSYTMVSKKLCKGQSNQDPGVII